MIFGTSNGGLGIGFKPSFEIGAVVSNLIMTEAFKLEKWVTCVGQEDYKRGIAVKAAETLDQKNWTETEIGEGAIGDCAIKAVQRNLNLIGRFQVSSFADKVREDFSVSERLFDHRRRIRLLQ